MGLGESVRARALEAQLDEKLRDRLKALQAREAELITELGEQPVPDVHEIFRELI